MSNNRNVRINNSSGHNNNMFNFGGSNISINFNGGNQNSGNINFDPQNIMNLINSVTSGMNFNFNNGFFNGGMNNQNNVYNVEDNDENDDFDFEDDEYEENENNEENEEDDELFMRKREQYILELDEFQYKHLKKYSALKEDKCPICLQKYKSSDIIKEFPCKHIFHKSFIFKWLKKSNVCPLCKHDITEEIKKVEIKEDDNE